jgi:geranylgeranyl diphosphate synthase, type I
MESTMNEANAGSFEALLGDVKRRVDDGLAAWLGPKVAQASKVSAEVHATAASVERLALRGGKRMRAALVAAGFVASGDDDPRTSKADLTPCTPAMLAIELLQVYLLVHDDWMDDDNVRRGGPAVHVALREELGSQRLGDTAAILAGDLASAYAQEALLESTCMPERVLRAARAFARIQEEVVIGQLAEMRAPSTRRSAPSVETIHALKTASYTVTGPVVLGALLAGADDARAAGFERFGRPLGIAFQLRDDLLGVFGDPTATGKPIWNDIRQGKRTALVAELRGDKQAEALFERVAGKPGASPADLEAVVRAMETSGARARVEARVKELCLEAHHELDAIEGLSPIGRGWLAGAIRALGERAS